MTLITCIVVTMVTSLIANHWLSCMLNLAVLSLQSCMNDSQCLHKREECDMCSDIMSRFVGVRVCVWRI